MSLRPVVLLIMVLKGLVVLAKNCCMLSLSCLNGDTSVNNTVEGSAPFLCLLLSSRCGQQVWNGKPVPVLLGHQPRNR